jgi:predicted Zn-dependent protease
MSALKVRIAGGIRFERSNEYAFGNDQVAFRALVRTGAVTVDPNAVKFFRRLAPHCRGCWFSTASGCRPRRSPTRATPRTS